MASTWTDVPPHASPRSPDGARRKKLQVSPIADAVVRFGTDPANTKVIFAVETPIDL